VRDAGHPGVDLMGSFLRLQETGCVNVGLEVFYERLLIFWYQFETTLQVYLVSDFQYQGCRLAFLKKGGIVIFTVKRRSDSTFLSNNRTQENY